MPDPRSPDSPGALGVHPAPELAGAPAVYVTGEDHLRLRSFNGAAGVTLALEGRFLDGAGRTVAFVERHVPNVDRTEATSTHTLGEGFLLNASVRASGGTPRRGQCFVVLELVRGRTGAIQPLSVLLQGYATDTARIAWPGSTIHHSADGAGVIRSITGSDPAAGVEISETVPTNARWRLLAVAFTLVTDVTVANREPALVLDDGATVFARVPAREDHTASNTRLYSYGLHLEHATPSQDPTRTSPIPGVSLMGGFRIRTITTNLQAGDNYGAPQLLVEEWIED